MDTLLDHEDKTTLQNHANTQTSASVWLAGLWTFCVSAWAIISFVQLQVATTLIELAGLNRGTPINDDDHFSQLPELATVFDNANLTVQNQILWFMIMAFFAVTGAGIAAPLLLKHNSMRLPVVMATAWFVAVAVGVMNFETIDLITWLDN